MRVHQTRIPLKYFQIDPAASRHGLEVVRIPRCLRSPEPVKSKRIVTFVNASQQAYGAAVYIRCKYNDAVTSRLIAAKSKVAPLTPITVLTLELMGAILGLRLTQSLLTVLELPMQCVTFYFDSMFLPRRIRPICAQEMQLLQV